MVAETQIPTLAKIKNDASEIDARALLYIAVCEVCDFFNVGKNMNDIQIAATVDLILESFWYLKPTEIKYCFRRAMMREKLFDRLDGNIIIGWLRAYDAERTEEAMSLSEREETRQCPKPSESAGAVSYQDYLDNLRERAKTDDRAAEILKGIDNPPTPRLTFLTREERSQKEHDLKLFTFQYLLEKKR